VNVLGSYTFSTL